MLLIGVLMVLSAMSLLLIRAVKGPTLPDRILAVNAFGTKTVALVALISLIFKDTMLVDIALVYAIINFITTIALLKYFERGSFKD
ncbi:MAG: pH regulation protein F [Proteobacteria bacterium]|nr:pH regulation protein F [Pseudomonadota bacterium]